MMMDSITLVLEPSGRAVQVPRSIMGAQANINSGEEMVIERNPSDASKYFGPTTSKTTTSWLRPDDTLDLKSSTLRRAWREFDRAFTFCTIMPMVSMSGNIRVLPCDLKNPIAIENARKIGEWLDIFEADIRQQTLKSMGKPLCEYWRLFGENFFEFRFLRDKSLKQIGYPTGMMLKRIHLLPSYRIPREADSVIYSPDGDLTQLKFYDNDGVPQTIEPPTINRFHHMKNRPEAERRGMSFLAPMIRPFASEQDLLNISVDAFDLFVHPIEQHTIHRNHPNNGPNLTPEQHRIAKAGHIAQIQANRWRHNRMYITDEYANIDLKGANQKMVDPYNMLRFLERRNMKGAMIPNMFEGEDVNKATMQEIRRFSHIIHSESIDYAAFKHFCERILFPVVLWTMGRDPRYIPVVVFPQLRSADRLEDLQADQLAIELYGDAHKRQLAAEKGIDLSPNNDFVDVEMVGGDTDAFEVVLR